MPAASPRLFVRLAAIVVAALVLGAAYELPPRMELSPGPHPKELVGTYEVMSISSYNPTNGRLFMQMSADGRLRMQSLRLTPGDSGLAVDVLPPGTRPLRWSVRHPSGRRTLATVFGRPQLCMHTPGSIHCTPFEREVYTGNLSMREEPTVVHRDVVQRYVRVRSQGVMD